MVIKTGVDSFDGRFCRLISKMDEEVWNIIFLGDAELVPMNVFHLKPIAETLCNEAWRGQLILKVGDFTFHDADFVGINIVGAEDDMLEMDLSFQVSGAIEAPLTRDGAAFLTAIAKGVDIETAHRMITWFDMERN